MGKPFLARRRRWPLYLMLAAAALVIAVAAGLIAEAAFGPHPRENFKLPPVQPLPGSGTPARAAGPPGRPAGGPLQVINGRRLEPGGIRTGFPRTLAGAVSAAVAGLEPGRLGPGPRPRRRDRPGHRGAVVAGGPAALAAGVRRTRAGLGLPASGPVPAGAQVTFTAVGYQVRHASRSQVTVLLLAYYTATVPGQQPQTSTGVYPATMRWEQRRLEDHRARPARTTPPWTPSQGHPGRLRPAGSPSTSNPRREIPRCHAASLTRSAAPASSPAARLPAPGTASACPSPPRPTRS